MKCLVWLCMLPTWAWGQCGCYTDRPDLVSCNTINQQQASCTVLRNPATTTTIALTCHSVDGSKATRVLTIPPLPISLIPLGQISALAVGGVAANNLVSIKRGDILTVTPQIGVRSQDMSTVLPAALFAVASTGQGFLAYDGNRQSWVAWNGSLENLPEVARKQLASVESMGILFRGTLPAGNFSLYFGYRVLASGQEIIAYNRFAPIAVQVLP